MSDDTLLSNLGSRVDLQLRQGADFSTSVSFSNADGTPVDLTGATFAAQIKQFPNAPTPVASFAVAVAAPLTGVLELSLAAGVTAAITCGNSIMDDESLYCWALKWTDAASPPKISTPMYGQVRVSPRVTA